MKSYKECRAEMDDLARALSDALRVDDPRLKHDVRMEHVEGTSFFFRYAFYEHHIYLADKERSQGFYIIVTEHHRHFVYDDGDVTLIAMYRRADSPDALIHRR